MQIPADYGYVIMATGFIGLVNLTRGGAVMGLRKKFFKVV